MAVKFEVALFSLYDRIDSRGLVCVKRGRMTWHPCEVVAVSSNNWRPPHFEVRILDEVHKKHSYDFPPERIRGNNKAAREHLAAMLAAHRLIMEAQHA